MIDHAAPTRRIARTLLSGGDLGALACLFGGDRVRALAALRQLLAELARRSACGPERPGIEPPDGVAGTGRA